MLTSLCVVTVSHLTKYDIIDYVSCAGLCIPVTCLFYNPEVPLTPLLPILSTPQPPPSLTTPVLCMCLLLAFVVAVCSFVF